MTTVKDALESYLATNGFSRDAYTAPTVHIPIGPIVIPLPSSPGRQAIVKWHDLHHVATGYGTDLAGEAEIGAWELRAGCTTFAGYLYNALAAGFGLFVAPLRTVRAFIDARGATTLYRLAMDYDEVLALELATLRVLLRLGPNGVAQPT